MDVFKVGIIKIPRLVLARCYIYIIFLSNMFINKILINLQFGIILNNETIVFESFIQKFCMEGTYFPKFSTIPKIN